MEQFHFTDQGFRILKEAIDIFHSKENDDHYDSVHTVSNDIEIDSKNMPIVMSQIPDELTPVKKISPNFNSDWFFDTNNKDNLHQNNAFKLKDGRMIPYGKTVKESWKHLKNELKS